MRRREFIAGLGGAAWPLAAFAQQSARVPVIGFLHGRPGTLDDRWVAAFPALAAARFNLSDNWVGDFKQGLADAGFIVGENVAIELRWTNLQFRQLPSLVSDLINRQAAVIFAADSRGPIRAAQAATATIPIVFYYGGDPVKDGFVASLSRPGGNLTGLTTMTSELGPKRLSLLHEIVPQADTIGFLTERGGDDTAVLEHQNAIRGAARSLGLELVEFEVVGPVLARAFATFAERQVSAVLVDNVATLGVATPAIVRLEQQYKIPTMYPAAGAVRRGGLMSYGSKDVLGGIYRQAASQYVSRILKGAKPADLPVQQPTRFELVINASAARMLGLAVPDKLVALADEVIDE